MGNRKMTTEDLVKFLAIQLGYYVVVEDTDFGKDYQATPDKLDVITDRDIIHADSWRALLIKIQEVILLNKQKIETGAKLS